MRWAWLVAGWVEKINVGSFFDWETLKKELNARHPVVLLKTIKIHKYRQNTTKFITLYHFWTTCFDSLESSSGPLVNRPKTI